MLTDLGWDVRLYGGENNEANCTEYIPIINKEWQTKHFNKYNWNKDVFYEYDSNLPWWVDMNQRAASEIAKRMESDDILGITIGNSQKPLTLYLPKMMAVEVGVGYLAVFAEHRIYDSYAWQNYMTGVSGNYNIRQFDAVIPPAIEMSDFPEGSGKGNYFMFIGRMTKLKGIEIAARISNDLGVKLILAGQGLIDDGNNFTGDGFSFPKTHNIEYVGRINVEERAKLLGGAIALLAPTTYLEPFGMVVTEAMACGTPVITTDWGGFSDTVIHDITGYRCKTLNEFISAAQKVGSLNRKTIRGYVVDTFSTDVVKYQYDTYFKGLLALMRGQDKSPFDILPTSAV